MFTVAPMLKLDFNEPEILFDEIEEKNVLIGDTPMYPSLLEMWKRTDPGKEVFRKTGTKAISHYKINPKRVLNTITAGESAGAFHYNIPRTLTKEENCKGGSYPLDYNFCGTYSKYLIGMSVPPVMTAQIAKQVYEQWLSKL